MYDPPRLRAVNDAFWQAIRAALPFDAPAALTRNSDPWEDWMAPDLVLSQTCGLPYRARLHGRVHLVATPDYGLLGCPPGYYNSTLVSRAGPAPEQGAWLAFNDALSQSGWGAAQEHHFYPVLETGSHAASLKAVADGTADVAVIDSHTLTLLGLPEGLVAQGTTSPTPALPFITSKAQWVAPLRSALAHALETLPPNMRAALGIRGMVAISAHSYLAIPIPPTP